MEHSMSSWVQRWYSHPHGWLEHREEDVFAKQVEEGVWAIVSPVHMGEVARGFHKPHIKIVAPMYVMVFVNEAGAPIPMEVIASKHFYPKSKEWLLARAEVHSRQVKFDAKRNRIGMKNSRIVLLPVVGNDD